MNFVQQQALIDDLLAKVKKLEDSRDGVREAVAAKSPSPSLEEAIRKAKAAA